MKKRKRERVLALILVFVLASVASVANATLIWTLVDENGGNVELGDYVLITVSSDTAEAITWGVYFDTPGDYPTAELTSATILPAAGVDGLVTAGTPASDDGHAYISGPYGSGPQGDRVQVGDWSSVRFVSSTADTYAIRLTSGAYGAGTLDTQSVTVVPEPATIALLGLGGLLLMRRRK